MKTIDVPKNNLKKHKPIDSSFICKYLPEYGFKLAIDSAANLLASKTFTIAVTSLSKVPYMLGKPLPVIYI